MHLTSNEINALAQIVQKGWGVSSMPNSVTCSLAGDVLTFKFITVVHFAADQALRNQTERISYESIEILTKCVADAKSKFKAATKKTLKLKELSNTDSLEVISANNLSPRRAAYYRRQVSFKIG
jgi:short-subunit dehydrogenase involved in D-alanine esterification of teichoic acids